MKILMDECTPRLLKRQLSGFELATVQEMGWTGVTYGGLLRQAADQFDVFLTTESQESDQN